VKVRLDHNRLAGAPMEPRGVLARYDAGSGELTLWLTTQNPFLSRADLAAVLGFPEHKLRVIAPDVGGGFGVKGLPKKIAGWDRIGEFAHRGMGLPADETPGLEATVFFRQDQPSWSFGAGLAVVRVVRETGQVRLERFVAVDDCGNAINPLLIDGQIVGGFAQGLGQALLERIVYGEDGQLLTGTFMDYAIPRADDMPELVIDRTVTPSPLNPLGVKGVGEGSACVAPPAIANAVVDALAPFGVRHVDIPLTPEKIWRAIRDASGDGA
jgi:carbon-monoxide dehydrogenase large subunit